MAMSDDELRKVNEEIDGVAQAIFMALADTAITVSDEHWWGDVIEPVKDDLRRLAAAAIDKRDEQTRKTPTFHLGVAEVKLLTGDISDHGDDAEAAMAAMLPVDQRMRDWLAVEHDPAAEPRPLRILLLEAPGPEELSIGDGVKASDVVQGSMELVADADEVFVFQGDKAVPFKHRDREPEDVHVAIQRRSQ